ncbi:hypothetical protein L3Q82_017136 [Scortum barcoo]|uniref:Uncharacterized protein n=1 Tax=Scortum barcoo TaxID=214431 RepID=A0ACB8X9I8_9TELE|nr:hypothetical protein L3Q82_017136 [Scortum barcoo]
MVRSTELSELLMSLVRDLKRYQKNLTSAIPPSGKLFTCLSGGHSKQQNHAQQALATVDVKVHDSTIRKRVHKFDFHGRCARRKPLLSKKNIKARLKFARERTQTKTRSSGIMFFGQMSLKLNYLDTGTCDDVWGCFAASGPGQLTVIDGIMNSGVYQKILKDNVRPSVRALKLKRSWIMQQDNDPKHTSKSTSEWLKKNKMKVLEWPSQSPDLNPIEMLWSDLKRAVHARRPSNMADLKRFCKEEWAKIPPQRCERLITNYRKRLISVIAAKGGPTPY